MKSHIHEVITKWLEESHRRKAYLRFDDLHIDEISSNFKTKSKWLSGGRDCLTEATNIRDRLKIPLCVALAYPLQSGKNPRGMNFDSSEKLMTEFSHTSPSLYLVEDTSRNWLETPKKKVLLPWLNNADLEADYYYIEYLEAPDSDYRRSLWVVNEPTRQP